MAGTTRTADAAALAPAPADGSGAVRSVRPRRALPGGRAVVGGLLVAVAAVGTFAAYGDATAGPGTEYAVAAHDVPVGAVLGVDDVELRAMDLPGALAGRAFTSVDALVGAVTLAPLAAGELVQAGVLRPGADGAPGAAQLSFAVPADRAVNGRLQPGERADVVATYGTGASAWTAVVVRRALVVDNDEGADAIGAATRVLTIALDDPDDVVRVAHAVRAGEVTVVRAGSALAGELDEYRPVPGGG